MNETFKTNLRRTLSSLIGRTRVTLPCPIPFQTVYRSAFPESYVIQRACRPGGMDDFNRDMARANLMRCTLMGRLVSFSLDDPAIPVRAPDEERFFWMKVPWEQDVIAPPLGSSLYIDPYLRHDKDLLRWYDKCKEHDNNIEKWTFKLYEFARLVDNPAERDALWPALGESIDFGPRQMTLQSAMAKHKLHRIKVLKDVFQFMMPDETRIEIEEALASAVLLPNEKPLSWAGDPTLEHI